MKTSAHRSGATAEEFARLFQFMSPEELAQHLGISLRNIYRRRVAVENQLGITLTPAGSTRSPAAKYDPRYYLKLKDGEVLIGGDAHIWPGPLTTAQRAFVHFAKKRSPAAVILNGDVFDFPGISRHPPIGWQSAPTVRQEMDAVGHFLHELEKAAGKKPKKVWTLGNHDARFETRLASVAPEFRGVHGISIKDHYPNWVPAWSCEIGPTAGDNVPDANNLIAKHRYKGGIHATHNNALWAGRSMATNHLHSLKVTPYTDYNGTRYGIDCGTLADPSSAQFSYTEDNPLNHRSGFVLLTWKKGVLLYPEVVFVHDDTHVQFRGELIRV